MRSPILCLLTFAAFVVTIESSQATTITFEDIGVTNSIYPSIPNGFQAQGFMFSHNVAVMDVSDGSIGSNYGPAFSGKYIAINNYLGGGDILVTKVDQGDFDFSGIAIFNSVHSFNGYGYVEGYKKGVSIGEVGFVIGGSSSWMQISAELHGIDKVKIATFNNSLIFFDDVQVSAVPESTSIILLLTGLATTNLVLRRKKRVEGSAYDEDKFQV